jgi:hypothetical protein
MALYFIINFGEYLVLKVYFRKYQLTQHQTKTPFTK